MKKELQEIYEDAVSRGLGTYIFEVRSIESMIEEWRSHNLLYDLHILRKRTKDVDINIISKIWEIIYKVSSIFYLP